MKSVIRAFSILPLLSFTLNVTQGRSQDVPKAETGIFLTETDFQANNISMLATTDNYNGTEQRLDDVIVTRQGITSKYKFGEIGGYYKNGIRYRAFGDKGKWFQAYGYYKVIDDSGLIVYSRRISGGQTLYFYSQTLSSPIKRVNQKNIRKDFADHPEFVKLATTACKNSTAVEVMEGRTVLNDLYIRSVRGK